MLSILLAVPSCFNSVWHGVIPTSYLIFNDFYTCREGVVEDCCVLSILLAVPSCFNSFWHGVIPTSLIIFTLVSLINWF